MPKLKSSSNNFFSTTNKPVDQAAIGVDVASLTDGKIPESQIPESIARAADIPSGNNLSNGDVTTALLADSAVTSSKIASNAVTTSKILDDAVTFNKIQNINSKRLLGNSTSNTGPTEQIQVGEGLSLVSGVLRVLDSVINQGGGGGNTTDTTLSISDILAINTYSLTNSNVTLPQNSFIQVINLVGTMTGDVELILPVPASRSMLIIGAKNLDTAGNQLTVPNIDSSPRPVSYFLMYDGSSWLDIL